MKSRILNTTFLLLVTVGLTTIAGCKKGENDPFLSLKTRKGRITGEWKLVEGTIVEIETIGGTTGMSEITYTGTTKTESGQSSDAYTETMKIERDGTYEQEITQNGTTLIIKGNWYFSGKSEKIDLKKKEAIVFSETAYVNPGGTIGYGGLHADRILLLDQLKNKQLIFKGFVEAEVPNESASYSYDLTFEKQ